MVSQSAMIDAQSGFPCPSYADPNWAGWEHVEDHCTSNPLSVRMSHFLALFRHFLPDLHAYFEEEAVDMRELAHAWLEGLFAKEMQIGMLMRVWGKERAIK